PDVAGIRTARGIRHGCARIDLRPAAGEDLERHKSLLLREFLDALDRSGKIGGVNSESECVEVVETAHVAVAPGSGSQRALEIRQRGFPFRRRFSRDLSIVVAAQFPRRRIGWGA